MGLFQCPLKRGGQVCLPLESVMVRRNKSVFICGIRGRAFIRDYSLGNISLDLCSHRLHGFSQIFCCLGNSCLQMSGCVVRMENNLCGICGRLIHPWGRLFFRKSLFRFMLPQIARIFTDFLLLGQQLLADEWMCSPQE